MGRYTEIVRYMNENRELFNMESMTAEEVAREAAINGVPQDYIDFLTEVGCGSVLNSYFHFYGGLVEATEIFDHLMDGEEHEELEDVLLFGDNGSGDGIGFLTTDGWRIVEIWHDDNLSIQPREEKSFEEFVLKLFADRNE
ncbi:SMI1/KNR4 family protein [Paenibacillus turpanensis]|uniref:SMI1/KNR4 family protein n=1 Tax=Paenibacillus turpanensis TaxID=2689078 RepID=UPI00140B5E9D|nr:SMI1/KNR4 family protein [Paenibacillus turpanensis]